MTLKRNDYDYNGNKRSALPHYRCFRFYSESLLIQPTTWGRLLEAWLALTVG